MRRGRAAMAVVAAVALIFSCEPLTLARVHGQSVGPGATHPVPRFVDSTPSTFGDGPPTPTPTETATPANTPTATSAPTATVAPAATNTPLPPATATPAGKRTATAATPSPVQESAPPPHYVVLIVVDGARPSYFDYPGLPHIRALEQNGAVFDRAWVGQMESSTPGVHVTYGTGTLPRQNGFSMFGWVTADTHKRVDYRALLANGQIDPVLRALPLPSVAARLHQFMPDAVSVAASGHKDYAVVGLGGGAADFELFGKSGAHVYRPAFMHAPPPLNPATMQRLTLKLPLAPGKEDAWAFDYALSVARVVRPKLLMLNVPEPDTLGHWSGPRDRAVFMNLMKGVDAGIGHIESTYSQLGILNQTDFILTADHSMMESRPVPGWSAVDAAAAAAHTQILRAGDGPLWLGNPAQAKLVAQGVLRAHLPDLEAIYYRSALGNTYHYVRISPSNWFHEKKAEAAMQHLVDTAAGLNGPDVWVLFRENYTVIPRNVSGVWKGTHGGQTWEVQHVPLILSGPGIKKGVHLQFGARAIDIAPTMERLLGLPPIQRDGVILANALVDPLPGEGDRQQSVAASVNADVEGLQDQSEADQTWEGRWTRIPSPVNPCGESVPASKTPALSCITQPHSDIVSTPRGPIFLDPQSVLSGDDG